MGWGIAIAVIIAAAVLGNKLSGSTPDTGTSFTAGLVSGIPQRHYKPCMPDGSPIIAYTPAGVRVLVKCPHRSGHPTPRQAVNCGQREIERIERTGR